MTYTEATKCINNMTIVIDTREQNTEDLATRISQFQCKYEKSFLNFGDYTAKTTLPDGTVFSLDEKVVIERKMDFSELCSCFTNQRKRFSNEFDRAASCGVKIYLLVERASWEKAYNGVYRSKMTPKSLVGSMTAWLARYNCQIIFCERTTTGKLIYDILAHEMREQLMKIGDDLNEIPKH